MYKKPSKLKKKLLEEFKYQKGIETARQLAALSTQQETQRISGPTVGEPETPAASAKASQAIIGSFLPGSQIAQILTPEDCQQLAAAQAEEAKAKDLAKGDNVIKKLLNAVSDAKAAMLANVLERSQSLSPRERQVVQFAVATAALSGSLLLMSRLGLTPSNIFGNLTTYLAAFTAAATAKLGGAAADPQGFINMCTTTLKENLTVPANLTVPGEEVLEEAARAMSDLASKAPETVFKGLKEVAPQVTFMGMVSGAAEWVRTQAGKVLSGGQPAEQAQPELGALEIEKEEEFPVGRARLPGEGPMPEIPDEPPPNIPEEPRIDLDDIRPDVPAPQEQVKEGNVGFTALRRLGFEIWRGIHVIGVHTEYYSPELFANSESIAGLDPSKLVDTCSQFAKALYREMKEFRAGKGKAVKPAQLETCPTLASINQTFPGLTPSQLVEVANGIYQELQHFTGKVSGSSEELQRIIQQSQDLNDQIGTVSVPAIIGVASGAILVALAGVAASSSTKKELTTLVKWFQLGKTQKKLDELNAAKNKRLIGDNKGVVIGMSPAHKALLAQLYQKQDALIVEYSTLLNTVHKLEKEALEGFEDLSLQGLTKAEKERALEQVKDAIQSLKQQKELRQSQKKDVEAELRKEIKSIQHQVEDLIKAEAAGYKVDVVKRRVDLPTLKQLDQVMASFKLEAAKTKIAEFQQLENSGDQDVKKAAKACREFVEGFVTQIEKEEAIVRKGFNARATTDDQIDQYEAWSHLNAFASPQATHARMKEYAALKQVLTAAQQAEKRAGAKEEKASPAAEAAAPPAKESKIMAKIQQYKGEFKALGQQIKNLRASPGPQSAGDRQQIADLEQQRNLLRMQLKAMGETVSDDDAGAPLK